ncbi:MAG: M36 family metallopeptidase [Niastella sp.]|uniref:M36 family metallopeptidase n=1 Tax=Niastella sp. TaxID=1869183 RepID=UPI003899A56E
MRKILQPLAFLCMLLFISSLALAQDKGLEEYRPLLIKNAARLGITPTDATDAVILQAYTDNKSHITYIYLQQTYQQIKVYNTIISAAFIDGSLQYASGNFVKNSTGKAGAPVASRSYMDAIRGAMRHLHLNEKAPLSAERDLFTAEKKFMVTADAIARRPIEITLYWTPSDDKQQLILTWNVNIHLKDSADWWNVRINAQTGEFVQKDNWTVSEKMPELTQVHANDRPVAFKNFVPAITQDKMESGSTVQTKLPAPPNVTSATYQVIPYPYESPNYAPFANDVSPWLKAGASNDAVTLGWHFDNVTNYTITRGNNVFAFLDRQSNNAANAARNWPDTSSTPAPSLTFTHNNSTAQQPWFDIESKKAALDNLFYWNNLMHDVTYQYGFTEAAGNFQRDNLGRGGAGNDFVSAQAQDSSGYSNANFSTPRDGTSGTMQMYTWASPPGFTISSPSPIAGNYAALESSFTSPNKLVDRGPITGKIVWYNDDAAGTTHRGCMPAANAAAVAGNIVLIDAYGGAVPCTTYAYKVKNAQNAGAIAVIIYFPPNSALGGIGGTDPTITIPTIVVTNPTGNAIAAQLNANQIVTATMSTGIYIDGDFDNGVICHEYGHGISNRLTGGAFGASCLNNAEQGGEGWSDFMALMMTTNWATAQSTDGPNPRPMATYAAAQSVNGAGIRRYPYSTNMSVNPLTYTNMATNTEVHAIGEIWCSALWDMTWNLIQQQNAITADLYNSAGNGGNIIAMNLVITGMKLQPCSPGFLDARNAILAADSILYGYSHKCAIWNAFARRGMGYSAKQGLSTDATDQTPAFDLPPGIIITRSLPVKVDANTNITLTRTATCNCQAATFTLRDTIPAGFTYVSSIPAGTLSGNILTFPATTFNSEEAKNFSITLQAPATGCIIDSVLNDNRDTRTTGGFTSSGSSTWTASTVRAHSGNTSWFAPDITTQSSTSLTSASTATTAAKPLSILSFWHNFRTETLFDGGLVEYSTDGGATWTDASPLFLNTGYTYTMDATTTLGGRKAFSGNSKGFEQTMVNLASFGTTPVQFRFRMETNAGGKGVEGWYVDDIVRANGCGEIMRSGIYDGSGVRVDSATVPVFVNIQQSLPLTLLWFYTNQLGGQVALDWKTVSEMDVKDFTVEWSADAVTWTSLGNVNAQNQHNNSYNFLHSDPVIGNNYYRIKMNDKDGRFTYSPVRNVTLKENGNPAVVLIPNPVNANAMLYISKEVKATSVKVYNAAGSMVMQLAIGAGVQQVRISTTRLAPGIYTIETNGANRQITRMMVQH